MQTRQLGPFSVSAIGLGCINLSHAYGAPVSREQGERVLLAALDAGVTFFDTAALYGFGANETLVGEVMKPHRNKFILASKCGMQGVTQADGTKVRVIDGRGPRSVRPAKTRCGACRPMSSTCTTCTVGTNKCPSKRA